MININARIKQLRLELGLNQEALGEILGIKRSGISNIESNLRSVTEQHIKLLTKENFNNKIVNENWLRTGEGSMFIELSNESTYYEAAAQLSNDPFAVAVLTEYYKRDDNFKKALANFVFDVSRHFNKDEE